MSDGPAMKEKKDPQAPTGINAALRHSAKAGAQAAQDGPYISRGLEVQKSEPERPSEPSRHGAAALHRAQESAHDPKATGDGFVSPTSLGMSVYGAAPLRGSESAGGSPHGVSAGGPASWARRTGTAPSSIGPPPANPLSVASPLGIGVAGGAWHGPQVIAPASAGNLQAKASETPADGPKAAGPGAAIANAWQGLWS